MIITNFQLNKSSLIYSFFRNSSLYVVYGLLEKLTPFLLLPIIVRMLSLTEYGNYTFYLTIETFALPLLSLNLSNLIMKDYYTNPKLLDKYISTLFFSYLLLLVFSFVIVYLTAPQLSKLLGFPEEIVFILVLNVYMFAFWSIILMIFRLQQKPNKYGFSSIASSVLLFLLLIFAAYSYSTFESLMYARLIYFFILFLIATGLLTKMNLLKFIFDKHLFIRLLKFSLPTVVFSITSMIVSSSDRFFIKHYLNIDYVGIYSGILQLCAVVNLLGASINSAWMPWLFENLNQKSAQINRKIVQITYLIITIFLLIGIVYYILFPFFADILLTPDFIPYFNISFCLIFAYIFNTIYYLISPYIYYAGKTKFNGLIGIAVVVINLTLNYFLIPLYGIQGAALVFFISWLLQLILFWGFSIKVYNMPWRSAIYNL